MRLKRGGNGIASVSIGSPGFYDVKGSTSSSITRGRGFISVFNTMLLKRAP